MKKYLSIFLSVLLISNYSLPVISYADEIIQENYTEKFNSNLEFETGNQEDIEGDNTEVDENQGDIEGDNTEVDENQGDIEGDNTEVDENQGDVEGDNTEANENQGDIEDDNAEVEHNIKEESLEETIAEDDLVGSVYSSYKKPIPKMTLNENIYVPEEYVMDLEQLNSLIYLEPKTESKYEVIYSEGEGIYTYVESAETADKAIELCKNMESSNEKIPAVIDENGIIIYSTNSMGRIIKHIDGIPYNKNDKNTDVYSSSSKKSAYTYVNHGYMDDVPILENNGIAAKVEVAGYTGWVNSDTSTGEFDIISVPMNQVNNPSYYISLNGELIHFISSDITSKSQKGYNVKLGPAPGFMKAGQKYYSYDGNYFYTSLETLINDAKGNNHNNAINRNNQFYSYYLYLPFRSKSNYTADQINKYISNNTPSDSILRGTGKALVDVQEKYGANAAIVLGIAMNESAKGTSNIAKTKNNLFGINAIDSDTGNATTFNSPKDCIDQFAKYYISKGYSDPQDWRYRGGYLGTKDLGANVKYASDPFWGEKAARYYYEMDSYLSKNLSSSLKDHNYYQLAKYEKENEVRSANDELLYSIKSGVSSNNGNIGNIIIVSNKNEFSSSSYKWYQIHPERNTESSTQFQGDYNWNDRGYVKTDGVKFINKSTKTDIGVSYNSYIEGIGWQGLRYDGQTSGTEGQNRRIEGINLKLTDAPKGMRVKYRAHVEGYGWQNWVSDGALAGTTDQWKRAEAIQIELEGAPQDYHVQYRAYVEGDGWQDWKANGSVAGTTGQAKRMEAIEVRIVKGDLPDQLPSVTYQSYIEGYGWQSPKYDGQMSGTVDQSKRIEGINISLVNAPENIKIKYRAHVEAYGWQNWVYDGALAGTTDQWKRAEAVQIELEGQPRDYHVQYRAYVEGYGWQDWVSDGEVAGTTGEAKRMEAIEIRIVKGEIEPQNIDLQYKTYVEAIGWQDWKYNGELAGTVNEWKQIEGIQLELLNAPSNINLKYQAYVEGYGWQDWVSNGELAGTIDKWKKIECIRIKLEGSDNYNVQYRAYIEGYGWQDWKYNGELAGILDDHKGIEGLEVKITQK